MVRCLKYALSACAVLLLMSTPGYSDKADDLKNCVGASKVKLVWTLGNPGFPNSGFNSSQLLLRYDTETGKEDTVFPGKVQNYQKPLITRDGKKIIYTQLGTGEGSVYMTDWDKPEYPGTKIARGHGGCLWYDEKTEKEYLLYTYRATFKGADPVYKIDINNLTDDTEYFNKEYEDIVGHWISISRDAKSMVWLNGWPNVIISDLTSGKEQRISGCWAAAPYDTTHRVVFLESEHLGWGVYNMGNGETKMAAKEPKKLNCFRFASYSDNIIVYTWGTNGPNGSGHLQVVRLADDLLTKEAVFTYSDTIPDSEGATENGNCFPELWSPKEPDIHLITPASNDTIELGDTLNVVWKYNEAYYADASGAVVEFSVDKEGASWVQLIPTDAEPDATNRLSAPIPKKRATYGNAKFVLPDTIVIGDEKFAADSKYAKIRVRDYGNDQLPQSTIHEFVTIPNSGGNSIRHARRPHSSGLAVFNPKKLDNMQVFDIRGRVLGRSAAALGTSSAGIYLVKSANGSLTKSKVMLLDKTSR